MEPPWTEGAKRALGLARQLAQAAGAEAVAPLHLLWALRRDESRAAEILDRHGLSGDVLDRRLPLDGNAGPDRLPDAGAAAERLGDDALVASVLLAARRAARGGEQSEAGSEHLLLGLTRIDSPASDILREHGLSAEAAAQHAAPTARFGEPLVVDFQIGWNERPSNGDATETVEDGQGLEAESEPPHGAGPVGLPVVETDTFRILDAAANRAREGLRVLEDFVRFALDDAHLTAQLKQCRHDLAQTLAALGTGRLLAARDTPRDVGTAIRTPSEGRRQSPRDVLLANFKRVQEATRTLEEFGKLLSADIGHRLGQLRYRVYMLEKAVLLTQANRCRFDGRTLYLLLTESLCRRPVEDVVRGALAGGVGVVQVREKEMDDRRLLQHARRVRQWTHEAGALLIMNDRPDLAVLVEADGVHVGQDELPVREARRIVGPDRLIGVSTHTLAQARQAVLDGADYLGVGPVFPSGTKAFDELAGLEFVRQVAAEITLPWFAIGGITADNIAQIAASGAERIAVSGALCGTDDPESAARTLAAGLRV